MNPALLSSKNQDWGTPPEIVAAVTKFAGGKGIFDPCPGKSRVGPQHVPDGDGLRMPWMIKQMEPTKAEPTVYVNPPYGRELKFWIHKAIQERTHCEIIMLVPSRTDTRWFSDCLQYAQAVCFLRGRLTFLGAQNNAPFPSALIYFGMDIDSFVYIFGPMGHIMETKHGD